MASSWSSVLVPQSVMFRLKPMNARGPASFSGRSQTVGSDAGYWVATLSNFVIRTPEQIREWRALVAELEGGLNDLIIGPYDCRQAPIFDGLPPVIRGIPHSDGALFSDRSGYSQSTIRVSAAASAALRATTLRLNIQQAGELRRGMYFTVHSMASGGFLPRMYMISKPPEISGNSATISFLPPLRAPIGSGDAIDFADPKLTMNLANSDTGQLDIRLRRFSSPSIELEESWNGFS